MIRIDDLFRWVTTALTTPSAPAVSPVPAPLASHLGKHGCADPLRRQHRRLRTVLSVSRKPWRRADHGR